MPRIPQLAQETRLQVTSPVPIGGTSGARTQGEAVAGFGRDLVQTADNLMDFFTVKKREEEKILLDRVEIEYEAEKSKALFKAMRESRDDGEDMLDIYNKSFEDGSKPLRKQLEGLDDKTRQKAENIIARVRNSAAPNIYSEVIQRGPKALDRKRREGLALKIVGTRTNPESAVAEIQKHDAFMDTLTNLYDAPTRESIKVADKAEIVDAAIDGYIGRKDFEKAHAALDKELAPFVKDADQIAKAHEKISNAKVAFEDKAMKDSDRAKKEYKEAKEAAQESNFATLFSSLAKAEAPQDRDLAMNAATEMLAKGDIAPSHYKVISGQEKEVSTTLEDKAVVTYTRRIAERRNLTKINSDIGADFEAGLLRRETAVQLMQAARVAKDTKKADPLFGKKMKTSDGLIATAIFQKSILSSFDFDSAEKSRLYNEVMIRRNDYVDQGLSPVDAGRKAIKEMIHPRKSLAPISGIPMDMQDSKNIDKGVNMLIQQREFIEKNYGKEEFNRRLKAAQALKQSLQVHGDAD